MAKELSLDPSQFTIQDCEDFERITGKGIEALDSVTDSDSVDWKMLKAIVFISMRKENPDFTEEEAGKFKVMDLEAAVPKAPARAKKATAKKTSARSRS